MKQTTQKLLAAVDTAHDWIDGQVRGGSGTVLTSTDTCQVCGLQRHYKSDTQNGIPAHYTFSSAAGESLTLVDALQIHCGPPLDYRPAPDFNEADCGGVFDGFRVTSDADPGL